ncbi:MAG: cytochrome c [Acidobacteria bacterium]|nr:cytochrome c [Acidobacteriota bacterium]
MTRKLIATLVLSLGVALIGYTFSSTQTVMAEQTGKKNEQGQKLFMQYCATCHGADAKGNGPTAKVLKKAPADLTKIEKVDGKFPKIKVQRIISGDDMLDSHGSRDMPVWGSVLRQKVGHGFAQLEIYNLTNYLESIQN